MPNVFDENALMERIDGDVEFLSETIVMLDEDSPALLDQIQAAVQSCDAAALAKAAHAIKSMVANFCAEPAESAARELEMMGRQERLVEVEAAAERLQHETDRLKESLHQFLRTKLE